jgi:hypothetical protein
MRKELVLLKGKKIFTTSEIIAKNTEIQHKNVIERIEKYENRIKNFGTLAFETRKSKGRNTKIYHLNESQAIFLITLMKNNEAVLNFKENLVKAFANMKKQLIYMKEMINSPEWKKIREETKKVRFKETDEIKKMIEYARENGSENAENYYMHYSNLIWKHLFIVDEGYENIDRNFLTAEQLNIVASAENVIRKSINEGLENEVEYHEIYQNTKDKIKLLASLLEITKIPYYTQISMI